MTIEFLFPEVCSLFGDTGNIEFIKRTFHDEKIIETRLNDEPFFVSNYVDFVYIGSMTESTQEQVINRLFPHKERLLRLIDSGTHFLATGNSVDIFGEFIVDDEKKIPALGLFPFISKRFMMNRYSGLVSGKFDGIEIVGFRAQFAMHYTGEPDNYGGFFIETDVGFGINQESKHEGFRKNNFIATTILGPLLVLNPLFSKRLFAEIAGKEIALPYEDKLIAAYERRLDDYVAED